MFYRIFSIDLQRALLLSYRPFHMHPFLHGGLIDTPIGKRRVLIVDDHNFFAACLRSLLDNESDLVVCDITTNSRHLRERIERLKPDLLLIDLSLGTEDGLVVGQCLREMGITTPIAFVSSMKAPPLERLTSVTHSAFIAKSNSASEFLTALRAFLAPVTAQESAEPAGIALVPTRAKA